jgi:hypothetical protein
VVGAVAWRALIGGLALHYALDGRDESLGSESLSYLSNLGTGICYLALAAWPLLMLGRRTEPKTAWLRSTVMIMMMLVMFVWIPGMGEEFDGPHGIIPTLVILDWLFVGRSQFRAKWWEPPTWTAFLLAYLVYHRSNDLTYYPDILGEDVIATMVPLMLGATILIAYLFFGAAKLRKAMSPVGQQM